jgi:hypothetical protein
MRHAPAVFIARLLGPFFVVIGLGILLNEQLYTGMIAEAVHSPTLIYFSGLFSLIPGLAILNVHRAWTADWRVIVTVMGWLLVFGGFVRIVLPQFTVSIANSTALAVVAVIALALGAVLSFQGYRQ